MTFFPSLPLHLNSMGLFGLTLLLGLVGGELIKKSYFLPVITGYIAIGFLVGPGGFNIVSPSVLTTTHIFVEISLSLILFELGRHLDFRWLYKDSGLLLMSLTEACLTFLSIFLLVHSYVGLPFLQAVFAGIIAISTSPAVVMMVANDLSSEGPVTRRTLILTSLNNFFTLVLFTILLPMTNHEYSFSLNLFYGIYRLFGSFILGFIMFLVALAIGHLIGKDKQNQFVLYIGIVVLTTSVCHIFYFSTMLALFTLGIAARNFDYNHVLMEIDFGWLAKLFFILLFVVTGVHLQLQGLWSVLGIIILFILFRSISKLLSILLFAKKSSLTIQQVIATSLALTPMSGIAIGMSNILTDFNPNFGHPLFLLITGVVALLNLFGPIATQIAFIRTGEALLHKES